MAINLQEILGLVPPKVTGMISDQIAMDQKQQGDLTAENVAQSTLALADAQNRTAKFAQSGNIEALLNQQVQEFNRASAEASVARANASQRLADLDQKMSVGLFDSPLDWLSNQITFDDDRAKASISVDVATAKTNEASGIRDQITALNAMTQSAAKTFNDIAQTTTADTAARAAQIERLKGNLLANQTTLASIEASNGYNIRLRNMELQEESAAREKERMAMARAEQKRNQEAATNDKNAFDLMWQTAELGMSGLGLPKMPRPASRQEFDLVYKTNPNLQAALSVGWNMRAGKTNYLGENAAESAAMLKATDAQGTQLTRKQVKFMKDAVDTITSEKAFGSVAAEQRPNHVNRRIKEEFEAHARNVDRNPDNNPARLPAPGVILTKPLGPESDPRTVAEQKALLESPFIKDLITAQKHMSDKPQEVLEFAQDWAARNNVSISIVSKQYAAMYQLTRQYFNEANRTVGLPPVAPEYEVGQGFLSAVKLKPTDAAAVQELMTRTERAKKMAAARKAAYDQYRGGNQ